MQRIMFKSYEEMSLQTAEHITGIIRKKPTALLCFPAGHTSLETYRYLVEWAQQGKVSFDRCRFVGLDEWLGLDREDENNCRSFMYKNLFHPLNLREDQIVFFNTDASDLDEECKRIDRFILDNGPIDLMMLGVGMNGHLALNEPGISFDLYSHVVDLDSVTASVGQKYFDGPVQLTKGITLGIRHIMESTEVILQVNGAHKAEIVKKVVEGPVTEDVPASSLRMHANALLYMDAEAASALEK